MHYLQVNQHMIVHANITFVQSTGLCFNLWHVQVARYDYGKVIATYYITLDKK